MTERPPVDITPAQFFESWLPRALAGSKGPDQPLTLRIRLDGDGGGAWDLSLGADGLVVKSGDGDGDAEPGVTLTQTVQDWRAIVAGEPGAMALTPPRVAPTRALLLDASAQELLAQLKGTIRFEVTGYNGRTWWLVARLGAGPVPEAADATLSVDAETYGAILARTLPPAAAYFQGKVKLSGDVNLAMQLGMTLMSRMGG
jgi:putative sterol carrier protein